MTISNITVFALALALSSGAAFAQTVATPAAPAVTPVIQNQAGSDKNMLPPDCKAGFSAQTALTEDKFNLACAK